MSLLDFLFRRNRVVNNNPENVSQPAGIVTPELFIDPEKPAETEQPAMESNPITEFLSKDYEWVGYQEGYAYPDTDHMDLKIEHIRSEFCLAIDKCLNILRNDIHELKIHLIKTEGISQRLQAQLEEKQKSLETEVHELNLQKILMVSDDGMISSATRGFRLGFRKGVERYQEEKFLSGNNSLFKN